MEKERRQILVYKHGNMDDKQKKAAEEIKDCARVLLAALIHAGKEGLVTDGFCVRGNVFTKEVYEEWNGKPDTRERHRNRIENSITSAVNNVDKLHSELPRLRGEFKSGKSYPNEHVG